MYYLALDGGEGWSLEQNEMLEEILKKIRNGETYGSRFKIFKELELEVKTTDE